MPLPQWSQIEDSKDFQDLPYDQKATVISKYGSDLAKEASTKPDFNNDHLGQIVSFVTDKTDQYKPETTEEKSMGGLRSAAAVVPFSKDIEGGLNTLQQLGNRQQGDENLSLKQLYDKNVGQVNEEQNRFTTKHPVASTAITLGAGLATLPLAEGAGAFNSAKGALTGENLARGAATGAIYGSDSKNPIEGAVEGGVLGAVAPVVLKGAGKVLEPVVNAGSLLGEAVARGIGILPEKEAEDIFTNHLGEKGLSQLKALGAESSPLDTRKGQILAKRVIAASPDAGDEIIGFLNQRADEEADKVDGLINTFINPQTKSEAIEDIAAEYKPIAQEQYAKAYQKPVRVTPRMGQLLDLFQNQGWLNKAEQIAKLDEVPFKLPVQGNGSFMKTMDADIIKQAMDTSYAANKVNDPAIARRILDKKREWVQLIDDQNKAYPLARKAGGDPIILEDAIEQGRNVGKLRPEEVSQYALNSKETSQAQKDAFLVGVKDHLRQGLAGIREGGKSTGGFKRGIRQNLKVLLGDNDSKVLLDSIDELENQRNSLQAIGGGSPTAPRQEEGSKILANAKKIFKNPLGGTAEVLLDPLASRIEGLNESNAPQLAKLLTSKTFSVKQLQDFATKNKLNLNQLKDAIENISKKSAPIVSQKR